MMTLIIIPFDSDFKVAGERGWVSPEIRGTRIANCLPILGNPPHTPIPLMSSSPPPPKDPVAARESTYDDLSVNYLTRFSLADSSFLCTYMGGHPSTLVAYVTYFGGVRERLENAKMTSINSRVGPV